VPPFRDRQLIQENPAKAVWGYRDQISQTTVFTIYLRYETVERLKSFSYKKMPDSVARLQSCAIVSAL
jgi:hypothetical protein